MRLFIAINFSEELKDIIYENELKIDKELLNGHITDKNNLHLTLVFIGETNKPKDISDVISKIDMNSFNILVKGLKYFKQRDKRLYYLDIEKNENLVKIYNYLYDELLNKGFSLEYREYVPHITLAREVILKNEVKIDSMNYQFTVNSISLMESKRINNQLKYIELYKKDLK